MEDPFLGPMLESAFNCSAWSFLGKFVNLAGLVDAGNTGKCASEFDSLEQLKEYTISTGKFFPKDSAYARGMLKFLLCEIFNKLMVRCVLFMVCIFNDLYHKINRMSGSYYISLPQPDLFDTNRQRIRYDIDFEPSIFCLLSAESC